jgi:hypothetical protein
MRFRSLRVPASLRSVGRSMFFAMLSAHSSRCGQPLAYAGEHYLHLLGYESLV